MKTTTKKHLPKVISCTAVIAVALPLMMTACPVHAQDKQMQKQSSGKNVRIMRNEDGTYTEFRRSSDERVIERRTYGDRPGGGGDRVLRMSIIYRKDIHGKLRHV